MGSSSTALVPLAREELKAVLLPPLRKLLSADSLLEAARYTRGAIRIPSRLEAAIAHYLQEFSTKELKKNASQLSAALRRQSKMDDDSSEFMVSMEIQQKGFFSKLGNKNIRKNEIVPKYKEEETAAYVAARMPAVYSAVRRVLEEISRRLPEYRPKRILDYGCGPGTALWALCEIWPRSIEHAFLVEQSTAMSLARRSLLQEMQDLLPNTKSYVSLEAFVREKQVDQRAHDLVIASYSLGEIRDPDERISVARRLWGLTEDILIIIEPGTPHGSNVVQEIRSHILAMERKRYWRSKRKGALSIAHASSEDKKVGAFVVAPCAHDGICPMSGTGKFCHFSQRLERSNSQLLCKRPKGKALRGYEDEKFSFLVLQRGQRPRTEWALDRVDPKAFEVQKGLGIPGGTVIIEGPFSDDESEGVSDDTEDDESDGGKEGETEEEEKEEEEVEEGEDDEEEEEEEEEEAAEVGSGWGRLVFKPMRRGRHVIVDVCRSAKLDGSKGMLERMVLTKSNNKLLHYQARRSKWGDLWPCGNL